MKVQTAFRIDRDLLELVKEKAKAQNRSLNNYIEYLLYQEVGNIPNEKTQQAIEDAYNNVNMTVIEDLDKYMEEIMKGEV